jgi:hypothetical protein
VNSSGNNPNATGSSSALTAPPVGTNSVGTAQSSGPGSGVTTGMAGDRSVDRGVQKENEDTDRKLKGICRAC